jgi:hypothetical protein
MKNEESYQTQIDAIVHNYLINNEITFDTNFESNLFIIPMSGDSGRWNAKVYTSGHDNILSIRTEFPFVTPEGTIVKTIDLLNRLNKKILIGKFYLFPEDGVVVYENNHYIGDRDLLDSEIEFILSLAYRMTNMAFNDLASVIFSNGEPALIVF